MVLAPMVLATNVVVKALTNSKQNLIERAYYNKSYSDFMTMMIALFKTYKNTGLTETV